MIILPLVLSLLVTRPLPHGRRDVTQITSPLLNTSQRLFTTLRIKHKLIILTFKVLCDMDSAHLFDLTSTTSSLPSPQLTKPIHPYYPFSVLPILQALLASPTSSSQLTVWKSCAPKYGWLFLGTQGLTRRSNQLSGPFPDQLSPVPSWPYRHPHFYYVYRTAYFSQLLVFIYWFIFFIPRN